MLALEDRVSGSLLGGALGDAIGAHYEGRRIVAKFSVPERLRITDDTQLTMATCEAILDAGCVNPESIAENFARWHRARRISGIGSSTLKALTELEAGGHWALTGAVGERAAGNGAAMRIAPLAFLLDPNDERDRVMIRDVARITHRHDEAYLGALAVVRVIAHVCGGGPLDDSLYANLCEQLPDCRVRDRLMESGQPPVSIQRYAARFGASGFVVDSVPLAILAAIQADDFMEAVAKLVQCGGDTDTNASLFGQMYGAAQGLTALPSDLIDRIDDASEIQELFKRFAHAVADGIR